jgi:hypothetical protein
LEEPYFIIFILIVKYHPSHFHFFIGAWLNDSQNLEFQLPNFWDIAKTPRRQSADRPPPEMGVDPPKPSAGLGVNPPGKKIKNPGGFWELILPPKKINENFRGFWESILNENVPGGISLGE